MIPSELAEEMGIEPSLMSKRLKLYWLESGEERQRHLNAHTVNHLLEAHVLLTDKRAASFKEAIQRVLGIYVEPLTPEVVLRLERRLEAIERAQQEILTRLPVPGGLFDSLMNNQGQR